jgi:hypothetical protein
MTPYPSANDDYENPSIVVSNDGQNWVVPAGLTNPIDGDWYSAASHNNDVDLVYNNDTDSLHLYWLDSGDSTRLMYMNSTNGTTWSSEIILMIVPDVQIISPSVDYRNGIYTMFVHNATEHCMGAENTHSFQFYNSTDGINWGSSYLLNITNPLNKIIWHFDVDWIPEKNEYWMIGMAHQVDAGSLGCGNSPSGIYFLNSSDGINFNTYEMPLVADNLDGWATNLYRPTFIYNKTGDDLLEIWYGGVDFPHYRIGYTSGNYSYISQHLNDYSIINPVEGSVCAWVKTQKSDSSQGIISDRHIEKDLSWFSLNTLYQDTNNYLVFAFKNLTTVQQVKYGKILNVDEWYYLCGIYNASGIGLAINGKLKVFNTTALPQKVDATTKIRIGTYYDDTSLYSFNGSIDELRIYNRSLSALELSQLYKSNLAKHNSTSWTFKILKDKLTIGSYVYQIFSSDIYNLWNSTDLRHLTITDDLTPPKINFIPSTPNNASLVVNNYTEINISITEVGLKKVQYNWNGTNITYKIDNDFTLTQRINYNNNNLTLALDFEGGANNLTDLSRNENNGVNNGATFNSTGGKYDGAYQFDGVDDYINLGSDSSLDNMPTMTLSAWIYPKTEGEGGLGYILDKSNSDTNGFRFRTQNTGGTQPREIGFRVDYSTTDLYRYSVNNVIDLNEWNHVVVTWNGSSSSSSVHIYVNGKEVAYRSNSEGVGTRVSDSSNNLLIGNNVATSSSFNGTIDEVRIYNRSLSAEEVYNLYNFNLTKYNSTNWNLYINQTGLSDGNYTYQAFASDSNDYWNATELRYLEVGDDLTAPTITVLSPINQTNYTTSTIWFNATANEAISTWIANYNGTNITLGSINSTLQVLDGNYNLKLYANDTSNNFGMNDSIWFNVDKTLPYFTIIPANDSIIVGADWGGVDFDAADEMGFDSYSINDSRFTINSTGFLDDISTLEVGNYLINVSINDTFGNENFTLYQLIVEETEVEDSTITPSGGSISKTDLGNLGQNGFSGSLVYGTRGDFSFNGETHNIYLRGIDRTNQIAKFDIYSEKKIVEVKVGETKEIDLNSDGISDITLMLNSIDENYMKVSLDLNVIGEKTSASSVKEEIIENKSSDEVENIVKVVEEVNSNIFVWIISLLILVGIVYFERKVLGKKRKMYRR